MTKETAAHKAYMKKYREARKQRTVRPDFVQTGTDTTASAISDPELHTPQHSQRLAEGLMDFLSVDDKRTAKEYRHYHEMTAREVSIAIGWAPWPSAWTQRVAKRVASAELVHTIDAL
jgi:hypothetical protein